MLHLDEVRETNQAAMKNAKDRVAEYVEIVVQRPDCTPDATCVGQLQPRAPKGEDRFSPI